MTRAVAHESPAPPAPAQAARPSRSMGWGATSRISRFFLRRFFFHAKHAPWFPRLLKRPVVWMTVRCSGPLRRGTFANARRILGPNITAAGRARFAKKVAGAYYDFVLDVGRSKSQTAQQLAAKIESVHGRQEYLAMRREARGAIILTAHMGSFEVGLASLRQHEPDIHVVFKRDETGEFEAIRKSLREVLGVHEAPVDAGWETWIALRDALARNHVVVMQGDRAVPGQKAQAVPMFGAHMMLPLGPIVLAQISQSPIVPVFVVRSAAGRCQLFVESPIRVDPDAKNIDGVHPQLLQWGKVLEKFIAAYPDQWLVLETAFVEDQALS